MNYSILNTIKRSRSRAAEQRAILNTFQANRAQRPANTSINPYHQLDDLATRDGLLALTHLDCPSHGQFS